MARRQAVCSRLRPPSHFRPVWFNAECAALQRACESVAARPRADLHEYKQLNREYRRVTQRARRQFVASQRDDFLCRLANNDPHVHDMLRKPKHTQQTPISTAAWQRFLHQHFCSAPPSSNNHHQEPQQLSSTHVRGSKCSKVAGGWGEWLRRGTSEVWARVQQTASSARETAQ